MARRFHLCTRSSFLDHSPPTQSVQPTLNSCCRLPLLVMKSNILLLWLLQLPLLAFVGQGADFQILKSGFNADGHFFARFLSDTNFYYVLRRGSRVAQLVNPRDLALPSCVFRCISDTDSDFGRTVAREISDSVTILAGQGSGSIRTGFRLASDRRPISVGQHSGGLRTVF